MNNKDKILEGLEIAYKRLIEYKKYKKTPIIISKDGQIVEINPNTINPNKDMYRK